MVVAVLDRTLRVTVLRVTDFDSAIHIRQLDVRSAVADLALQVVAHEAMMTDEQVHHMITAISQLVASMNRDPSKLN